LAPFSGASPFVLAFGSKLFFPILQVVQGFYLFLVFPTVLEGRLRPADHHRPFLVICLACASIFSLAENRREPPSFFPTSLTPVGNLLNVQRALLISFFYPLHHGILPLFFCLHPGIFGFFTFIPFVRFCFSSDAIQRIPHFFENAVRSGFSSFFLAVNRAAFVAFLYAKTFFPLR